MDTVPPIGPYSVRPLDTSLAQLTEFDPPTNLCADETSKRPSGSLFNKLFSKRKEPSDTDSLSSNDFSNLPNPEVDQQAKQPIEGNSVSLTSSHSDATLAAALPSSGLASASVVQQSMSSETLRPSYSRTLANVTQRIGAILNTNSTQPGQLLDYNLSSFKEHWMPDFRGKECYECNERFTTFRRRHHCRICGQIFCSRCCNQEIPGKLLGYVGGLRLCTYCSKAVLQFLDSAEGKRALMKKGTGNEDVELLKESLLRKFVEPFDNSSLMEPASRGSFAGKNSRSLAAENTGLTIGELSGSLDSLSCEARSAKSKLIAGTLSQSNALAARNSLGVTDIFKAPSAFAKGVLRSHLSVSSGLFDGLFHAPSATSTEAGLAAEFNAAPELDVDEDDEWEPEWVKSIESSLQLPAADDETAPKLSLAHAYQQYSSEQPSLPTDPQRQRSPSVSEQQQECLRRKLSALSSERNEASSDATSLTSLSKVAATEQSDLSQTEQNVPCRFPMDYLQSVFEKQAMEMLTYLLHRYDLQPNWFNVLWPIARQISFTVVPSVKDRKDESMDILKYVHVKTLQKHTGNGPSAKVVFGTVCTKSVADARMRALRQNPSILLVGAAVEYERVTGKFCSLDPVIAQESAYLKAIVSKVASFKPDIVVVQHTVARLAQEFFRQAQITLVYNVKASAFERIRRCTQADVVASVDGQIARPTLGSCGLFRTELNATACERGQKSLMSFEDCQPDLSCCVVLQAELKQELGAAKDVLRYLIRWLYSSKLEVEMLRLRNISVMHSLSSQQSRTSVAALSSPRNHTNSTASDCVSETNKHSCAVCEKLFAASPLINSSENCVDASQPSDLAGSNVLLKLADALASVPFSVSPLLLCYLPFLETETGKSSALKQHFKGNLFPFRADLIPGDASKRPLKSKTSGTINSCGSEVVGGEDWKAESTFPCLSDKESLYHPLISAKFTVAASDQSMRREIAKYRANSARLFRKRLEESAHRRKPRRVLRQDTESVVVDVLNPLSRQLLLLLYASYCERVPGSLGFCTVPFITSMEYFGMRDICLGKYLEEFCFKPELKCPVCELKLSLHVRKFVHGMACVQLEVEFLTAEASREASVTSDSISHWNFCSLCKNPSTPTVVNRDVWHMSLARYLEYFFTGCFVKSTDECDACLFHEHCQYFAWNNMVASFKVFAIDVYDIIMPPSVCQIQAESCAVSVGLLSEQLKLISELAGKVFSQMQDQLSKAKSLPEFGSSRFPNTICEQIEQIQEQHQNQFRDIAADLNEAIVTSASSKLLSYLTDQVKTIDVLFTRARYMLAMAVQKWNVCASEFAIVAKKLKSSVGADEKFGRELASQSSSPSLASQNSASFATPPHAAPTDASKLTAASPSASEDATSLCNIDASLTEVVPSVASTNQTPAASELSPSAFSASSGKRTHSYSDIPSVSSVTTMQRLLSSNVPSIFAQIPTPFDQYDHFALPLSDDLPVSVNELQISSMIAYALSSRDYKEKLKQVREFFLENGFSLSLKSSAFGNVGAGMGPTKSSASASDFSTMLSSVEWSNESGQHVEVQFNDHSTKFYCKLYFAEHFRMLRKLIFPQGEEVYLRSLARCDIWHPRGGKSGLNFFKTTDDRFVLKQMSRFEIQSFFKFAANYFQYIATANTENKLTCLAKIFGVYRIGFKNQTTGSASKIDLLVMENLFYNRNVSQIFDLKGSMRNRLVAENRLGSNGLPRAEDVVLLDENLLKKSCTDPLYIHQLAKSVLKFAVENDSGFLATNLIMDYSLLVGVDDTRKELIIGIIDYVRTYTWDKRLETFVKSVSVSGPLPTVISPDIYSNRFCDAMESYFLASPDQWSSLVLGSDKHEF